MDTLYRDLIRLLIEHYFDFKDALNFLCTAKRFVPYRETYQKLLVNASKGWVHCISTGKLDACQFYHRRINNDIHDEDEWAIRECCCRGHLDVAKWLFQMGMQTNSPINIHVIEEYPLYLSCVNGHMKIDQWLYQLSLIHSSLMGPFNKHHCKAVLHTAKDYCSIQNICWLNQMINELK